MQTYHIRTVEQNLKTPFGLLIGLETFDLDSICVPYSESNGLVFGIAHDLNKQSDYGLVMDNSRSFNRALSIALQNSSDIKGELIGEFDIDTKILSKIKENISYNERPVRMLEVFDGSTGSLVKILSGDLVPKNN